MSNSIFSIGQMASLIQAMPNRIRTVAVELGIAPTLRINGVDHYDECDVERIQNHLNNRQPKAEPCQA